LGKARDLADAEQRFVNASGDTINGTLQMGAVGNNVIFPRGTDNTTSLLIRSQSGGNELQIVNDSGTTGNMVAIGNGVLRFQTENVERASINSSGVVRFNAYGAGTLSTSSDGTVSASDGRYKTKTRDVENALSAIEALRPTYYKWDESSPFASKNEELGFIAQEVALAIPEASPGEDVEGSYRNYHDRAIIAMLVKSVQEQQAIINELKARVETLE
jgi:hypothetical protein